LKGFHRSTNPKWRVPAMNAVTRPVNFTIRDGQKT